ARGYEGTGSRTLDYHRTRAVMVAREGHDVVCGVEAEERMLLTHLLQAYHSLAAGKTGDIAQNLPGITGLAIPLLERIVELLQGIEEGGNVGCRAGRLWD